MIQEGDLPCIWDTGRIATIALHGKERSLPAESLLFDENVPHPGHARSFRVGTFPEQSNIIITFLMDTVHPVQRKGINLGFLLLFATIRSYIVISESMFLGMSDPLTLIDRIITGN